MEELIKQVVGLFVVLVLFALLFREAFEQLLSQPLVESLAGAGGKNLQKFGRVLKATQAYIVIALGCIIAWVLKLDVVTAINGLVALFPKGELDANTISVFTGVLLSVGSMVAHRAIKAGAKSPSPLATSRPTFTQ